MSFPVRLKLPLLLVLGLLATGAPSVAHSADPAFVGNLATLLEPEVAEELELSIAVLKRLTDLAAKREDDAAELVLEIRDLEPAEQAEKLAPYVAESESQAMALLSESQRRKFEQLLLRRSGLQSLAEPAVQERLQLSEEQIESVNTLLAERAAALAEGEDEERSATLAAYEGKLAEVLDREQLATWEIQAGLEPGALAAGTPRAVPGTEPAEPGEPRAGTTPAGTTPRGTDPRGTEPRGTEPGGRTPGPVQPPRVARQEPQRGPDGEFMLRFNFQFAPWKDVLQWFADQADLSLQDDAPPPGTFNYTDSRTYNPAQALDILNSVLLTKGYTLVRRERALMVINLEDGVPLSLIDQVLPSELDRRGEYELVACLFRVTKMTSEEAEAEIRKLLGPQGSIVVMPKAGQVLVTETAGRLRTIREVIQSVEGIEAQGPLSVMPLQHVTPEDVMIVARQILEIPDQQYATVDGSLRLAVDPLGSRFFVSGREEKVARFKEIMALVDVPNQFAGGASPLDMPQLEVYPVTGADPDSVLKVMQTLMAGLPDVRLAIDGKTGSLVALARPGQHSTIRATLEQMQRDGTQFEVIRLLRVDPTYAVLAINKLFGADAEGAAGANAPKVDADITSRQLLIRGSAQQVEQIRSLLQKMGEDEDALAGLNDGLRSNLRVLPYTGETADALLEQANLFWPTLQRTNEIRVVKPSDVMRQMGSFGSAIRIERPNGGDSPAPPQRDPTLDPSLLDPPRGEPEAEEREGADSPPADTEARTGSTPFQFTAYQPGRQSAGQQTAGQQSAGQQTAGGEPAVEEGGERQPPAGSQAGTQQGSSAIFVAPGPNGLVIASEDLDALDEFEALLETLSSRTPVNEAKYTVRYLKFAKADVAAELLREILGGGGGGGGDGGGDLLGGLAGGLLGGGMGDLMGGLLGMGGGDAGVTTTGPVTVVADTRLNALVLQGNPVDLDLALQLLEVIDQAYSPEEPQTVAPPRMIPVFYTPAEEIANVVRQVYADRVGGGSGGQQQRQPSPEEFIQALRGGGRGGRGGGNTSRSREQQERMTIGVDSRSNSLIVSAPEPLFKEVAALVEQLDQAGNESNETMRVVTIKRSSPELIQRALSSIVGSKVTTSTTRAEGGSSGDSRQASDSGRGAPSEDQVREQIRQRIEFFNNLQQGGRGGTRGGDTGGRGGSTGGRTGGGFGGARGGGR